MNAAGPAEPTDGVSDPWPHATALAERLVAESDSVRVILLYGSHLNKTNPDKHSAVDFVVIVQDYRSFYGALSRSGQLHRPVGAMVGLSNVLTPNVLAFTPDEGRVGIAKMLLISVDDFERATGPNPPDHFVLGRVVQRVGIVWTADEAARAWIGDRLAGCRARSLEWMAPYVEQPFDARSYGRRLLEVCYKSEFRPESTARAGRVFEAQAEHFVAVFEPILERAATEGRLRRVEGGFALAEPVTARSRRRWRWHLRRSKARTTARWFKHTVTFANWLPYIQRKVERHTGRSIELTAVERMLPIVFLWPRVVYVLLTRPSRELGSPPNRES